MNCLQDRSILAVNFSGFFSFIYEAIDNNHLYSNKLVRDQDKESVALQLQTYLIKNCGIFQLTGYCREGDIKEWYDHDVLVEEFDDLLLNFRQYLVVNVGLDLSLIYGLKRYRDNRHFILYEGQDDSKLLYGQYLPSMGDCEPFLDESDPFL